MSKNATLLLILILIASCVVASKSVSAYSPNTWTSKAPMSAARAYLGVAVVNEKVYAIGGDEGSEIGNCLYGTSMTSNVVNVTEEYDTTLDEWVSKSPMPTARARFGTAVHQGMIYCIGGYSGATVFVGPESYNWKTEYFDVAANEAYDPVTDTWETKTALPTPRHAAPTNIVDGRIYVIGGYSITTHSVLNVNEVYDPETDIWETKTAPPLEVASSASAVVDNKIYVIGKSPDSYGKYFIQIYDPANDSWSVGASAPVSFSATAGATTGVKASKRIYFFDENRTDVYNPTSDSWTVGTSAPTARLIAGVAVVDDLFYVIGGRTGQWGYMTFMYPSTLNEQYTPIGYGVPDASSPSPSPSPTPSPTPTPSESPTPPPEATPTNKEPELSSPNSVAVISGASVAAVGIGLFLYFKRRGRGRNS